jgi:hypothetical protein
MAKKKARKAKKKASKKPVRKTARSATKKSARKSAKRKPAKKVAKKKVARKAVKKKKAPVRKAAARKAAKAAPRKAARKSAPAVKKTKLAAPVPLGEGDWKSDRKYTDSLQAWGAAHDAPALAREAEADLTPDLRESHDKDVADSAGRGADRSDEPDEEW